VVSWLLGTKCWFIERLISTYLQNFMIKTILICPINYLIHIYGLHM